MSDICQGEETVGGEAGTGWVGGGGSHLMRLQKQAAVPALYIIYGKNSCVKDLTLDFCRYAACASESCRSLFDLFSCAVDCGEFH